MAGIGLVVDDESSAVVEPKTDETVVGVIDAASLKTTFHCVESDVHSP